MCSKKNKTKIIFPKQSFISNHVQLFFITGTAEPPTIATVTPLPPIGTYDLRPIPPLVADNGCGAYGSDAQSEMILPPRDLKRTRTCSSSSSSSWVGVVRGRTRSLTEVATSAKPAAVLSMVVDTQEEGVCLVHVLLACVKVMQ